MSTHRELASSARPEIKVRKPSFRFSEVPRYWLWGNARATAMANALNLVFPAGERFFIRSVKHFVDRLAREWDDPELLEQVRRFMGQEVRHGMEHERFFEALVAQGYEIRSFVEWYERIAYGIIEKNSSPKLRLAVTVALEHFTAMFAERALTRPVLSEHAHPAMRDLLSWHACEELEHKSVAFDVLQRVDPSYALRIAGLACASSALVYFWIAGAHHLMKQEPPERRRPSREELRVAREHNVLLNGEFLRAFLDYLRPDFHPAQKDDYHLAREWLARNGEAIGVA
ncbi:MAG: metal-dependent hydrolase [Deltaproteobacteria bacterium]|nr:metal-dependent hydrolase [Deltaproteobacteria bacterium]